MHRVRAQEYCLHEMKTSLKIFLMVVALAVITGCSAQKRAERHVRKAVELCPELAQVKARSIDTTLYTPAFTDVARVPLPQVLTGDTVYAATNHGTVVVSVNQPDSSLRVGFVAAPLPLRYRDTIRWREIDTSGLETTNSDSGNHFWQDLALWLIGIGLGIAIFTWIPKNKK